MDDKRKDRDDLGKPGAQTQGGGTGNPPPPPPPPPPPQDEEPIP